MKKYIGIILAGLCAGTINGTFGAGGGMVLVPLLSWLGKLEDDQLFPSSVSMILPICLVTLGHNLLTTEFNWSASIPYLLGSIAGGVAAGLWGKHIPNLWLHRILGALIIWGGVRFLC